MVRIKTVASDNNLDMVKARAGRSETRRVSGKSGSFGKNLLLITVVFLATILSYNALTYINFDPQYGFLRLKQKAIATGWYLPFYYSHVLVASVILVSGIFQLHPVSRKRFPTIHKWLGYFYVMGILFFAAPGGLVMSFFIDRGPIVLASFLLQTFAWFYCTAMAFDKIRKKNIVAHRDWMWRSYALTFAAITLRLYVFVTSWSIDHTQAESYATIAWLSWVPNLIAAEFYIRSQRAAT